jgi:hypothetical protein
MKTTTVNKSRLNETTAAENKQSTHPSQHEGDSSRYSWYYDEQQGEEGGQEREISISRFASVEIESLPMKIGLLRPESTDQYGSITIPS